MFEHHHQLLTMNEKRFKVISETSGAVLVSSPQVKNTTGWGENETKHFIDCVKNDKAPMSPPEQAVTMMRIIDAAYASATSGFNHGAGSYMSYANESGVGFRGSTGPDYAGISIGFRVVLSPVQN